MALVSLLDHTDYVAMCPEITDEHARRVNVLSKLRRCPEPADGRPPYRIACQHRRGGAISWFKSHRTQLYCLANSTLVVVARHVQYCLTTLVSLIKRVGSLDGTHTPPAVQFHKHARDLLSHVKYLLEGPALLSGMGSEPWPMRREYIECVILPLAKALYGHACVQLDAFFAVFGDADRACLCAWQYALAINAEARAFVHEADKNHNGTVHDLLQGSMFTTLLAALSDHRKCMQVRLLIASGAETGSVDDMRLAARLVCDSGSLRRRPARTPAMKLLYIELDALVCIRAEASPASAHLDTKVIALLLDPSTHPAMTLPELGGWISSKYERDVRAAPAVF